MHEAGTVLSYGPMVAQNQLRGYLIAVGEKKNVRVYFTLRQLKLILRSQQLDLEISREVEVQELNQGCESTKKRLTQRKLQHRLCVICL